MIAGSLEPTVRWTGFTAIPYLTGCRSPRLGWTGGFVGDDALSITATTTRRGPEGFTCSLAFAFAAKLSLGPSDINTRRGPFDASEGGKYVLSVLLTWTSDGFPFLAIVAREDNAGASVTGTREPTGINTSCGGQSTVFIPEFRRVMVFDRFMILRAGICGGCRGLSTNELEVEFGRGLFATNGRGGLSEGVRKTSGCTNVALALALRTNAINRVNRSIVFEQKTSYLRCILSIWLDLEG